MDSPLEPTLRYLIALGEESGLIEERWFRNLLQMYVESPDALIADHLMQAVLHSGRIDLSGSPFTRPHSPEEVGGEVPIGTVSESGYEVGLERSELVRHTLIVGETGSGKTNAASIIADGVLSLGVPVLIIDPKRKGGDYRSLAAKHPGVVVLKAQDLRLNCLRPPTGTRMDEWIMLLSEAVSEAMGFMAASESVLNRFLSRLYPKEPPQKEQWPTFEALRRSLAAYRVRPGSREAQYMDTIGNRFEAIHMALGDVFGCRRGFLEELMEEKGVIIELGPLSGLFQVLLCSLLVLWTTTFQIHRPKWGPGLKRLVVYDEAQAQLFSITRQRTDRQGSPLMAQLVAQARSMGIGLVILAQTPTLLLQEVLSNTCTKISFRLQDVQQRLRIHQSMGLTREQSEEADRLERFEAIVRLSDRYPDPLRVMAHPLESPYGEPTESQLRAHRAACIQRLMKHVVPMDRTSGADVPVEADLSTRERELLVQIWRRPYHTKREHDRDLSPDMTTPTVNKFVKQLQDKGYLYALPIPGAGRGTTKMLVLKDKGLAFGQKVFGKKTPYSNVRGRMLHSFWTVRIAHSMEAEDQVRDVIVGDGRSGKEVDVSVELTDGRRTALEITLSLDNLVENARKDLESGFYDQVRMLCTDASQAKIAQRRIERAIPPDRRQEVKVQLLREYFKP